MKVVKKLKILLLLIEYIYLKRFLLCFFLIFNKSDLSIKPNKQVIKIAQKKEKILGYGVEKIVGYIKEDIIAIVINDGRIIFL